MNLYEKKLSEITTKVFVDDMADLPLGTKGYYTNEHKIDLILLSRYLSTTAEKLCTLIEEIGHYHTTFGDITDQAKVENRKQEIKARRWAYRKLVGITDLIQASKQGIRNRHELAEFLGVTEEFLNDALLYYKDKYGLFYEIDNYIVYFEPLGVIEKFF
ncbi:hypothetical protein CACET_c32200 [Clostridium aceticum]|uniref:IrrE N-terminal-like domain-containing protein n=1 Tax=Clostridium aceticum TaxID=84022 RepID=A0A0D8I768_9CLOT|nr:ImmA/IrrE family metallo-endopeptidase [Clostridium aceticum]AKL96664.1 hypothetical protein CACET_c32200 [Clostridium aceticum]KJF25899.1 hypothetical protein TZ02_16055 [Clostridium aceticum]